MSKINFTRRYQNFENPYTTAAMTVFSAFKFEYRQYFV